MAKFFFSSQRSFLADQISTTTSSALPWYLAVDWMSRCAKVEELGIWAPYLSSNPSGWHLRMVSSRPCYGCRKPTGIECQPLWNQHFSFRNDVSFELISIMVFNRCRANTYKAEWLMTRRWFLLPVSLKSHNTGSICTNHLGRF